MSHADTAVLGQKDSRTIGVIAVVSDRSEDVSLVFRFAEGLSGKEKGCAAKKLHELASGLDGIPNAIRKIDEI